MFEVGVFQIFTITRCGLAYNILTSHDVIRFYLADKEFQSYIATRPGYCSW
jgi:hypothetical protein